jgi:hypothetical protein
VHAGAPALIGLRLRPEGGELRITGRLGGEPWEEHAHVPAVAAGAGNAAVTACYGREAVEDLEMRVAAGEGADLDGQIETLGLHFQIATRLTSWIAATEEATVDPGQPLRRERIPQALPAGLSAVGLGLRAPVAVQHMLRPLMMRMSAAPRAARSLRMPAAAWYEQLGAPSGPPPRRELRGRVVLRRDRELVVEIAVDELLAWDPADARAVWDGGTECGAEIDATRSTRPGAVKAGQVIRLVLRLDETALPGPPARIRLGSRSGSLDIALAP